MVSDNVKRVVIVGAAGTGKSTLARQLGERLGLPVVHLDALNWEPGWAPVGTEVLRSRLAEEIRGDAWITDGNYAAVTFDLRLPRADLFIWVEDSRIRCITRVLRRAIWSYFAESGDLAAGCKERFDRRLRERIRYIWNFDRVNRPRIEAARMKWGPRVPVIVLRAGGDLIGRLGLDERGEIPE